MMVCDRGGSAREALEPRGRASRSHRMAERTAGRAGRDPPNPPAVTLAVPDEPGQPTEDAGESTVGPLPLSGVQNVLSSGWVEVGFLCVQFCVSVGTSRSSRGTFIWLK